MVGSQRAKDIPPTTTPGAARLLTLARDLRRRRGRARGGLFVAEGVRAAEELLGAGLPIRGGVVAPSLLHAPRGRALRAAIRAAAGRHGFAVAETDDATFATLVDTETPQGVALIARVPERSFDDLPSAGELRVVALDAVQDPGNAGTIVRTAAALGARGVVALPGTVDLWNPKVVRSAMGALYRVPAFAATTDALLDWCRSTGVSLWGADAAGTPLGGDVATPERLALVVGNEGAGLSAAVRPALERTVAIPIAPGVESLNVAVAAGILLHALRP